MMIMMGVVVGRMVGGIASPLLDDHARLLGAGIAWPISTTAASPSAVKVSHVGAGVNVEGDVAAHDAHP